MLKEKSGTTSEHDSLDGRIVSISFRDNTYDNKTTRQIHLIFDDGSDQYQVAVGVGSGYGKQLILKLANADLTQPVEITPTYSEEGPRKNSGMFVAQFGQQLKQLWTRDSPGPMPAMKEVTFKGETVWDDSEQVEFLEEYVTQHFIPQIKAGVPIQPDGMSEAVATSGDGGVSSDGEALLNVISKTLKAVEAGDNAKLATIRDRINANREKLGESGYALAMDLWQGTVDRLTADATPF